MSVAGASTRPNGTGDGHRGRWDSPRLTLDDAEPEEVAVLQPQEVAHLHEQLVAQDLHLRMHARAPSHGHRNPAVAPGAVTGGGVWVFYTGTKSPPNLWDTCGWGSLSAGGA